MSAGHSPDTSRRSNPRRAGRRPPTGWIIAVMTLALGVTVAIIIGSTLVRSGGDSDNEGTAQLTSHPCAGGDIPVNGRKCGDDSAPVKIVELSDYQCPFCKRFVDLTEPLVEREYVENGLAQVEFRYLAITGGNAPPDENEATLAAEAAECANDQGRFWEYHYKLYAEQEGENQGAFLPNRLKQFASDLGLDRGEFDQCLESHKHISLIDEERVQAAEAGARATPSFLINGKLVVGYMSFEKFRLHIEEALAEQ